MALLILAGAGCGQVDKQELAYRNNYKAVWDRVVGATETGQKKADAAYAAGDVDTVVGSYKSLAATYGAAKTSFAKLRALAGYGALAVITGDYLADGAAYYAKLAAVVESTGGNYGDAQQAEIKALQTRWDASTKRLEKELAKKRFKL